MLKENETIISKINKILLSLGKFCLSVVVILTAYTGLAFLIEWVVPDFTLTENFYWKFLGLAALVSLIIRYGFRYRIAWWVCIACAPLVMLELVTIEQNSTERLRFHARMQEWKASGKKEIDLKELTDFEWERVIVEEYYGDYTTISCRERPELCNIYIPWLSNKNSWTMAFIKKDKSIFLIKMNSKDFVLGRRRKGGGRGSATRDDAKLMAATNADVHTTFSCEKSNHCIHLVSQSYLNHYKIKNIN